jgi:hypothetical protein
VWFVTCVCVCVRVSHVCTEECTNISSVANIAKKKLDIFELVNIRAYSPSDHFTAQKIKKQKFV